MRETGGPAGHTKNKRLLPQAMENHERLQYHVPTSQHSYSGAIWRVTGELRIEEKKWWNSVKASEDKTKRRFQKEGQRHKRKRRKKDKVRGSIQEVQHTNYKSSQKDRTKETEGRKASKK